MIIQESKGVEMIKREIEEQHIKFLLLRTIDIVGRPKGLFIPSDLFEKALEEGIGFDGSSLKFIGIEESDLFLKPDLNSFFISKHHGVVVGNFFCVILKPNGEVFERDSRELLRISLDKLGKQGLTFNIGAEVEFFLLRAEEKYDDGSYFDLVEDRAVKINIEFARALSEAGIRPEAIHHEVAPGQHEIDFEFSDALKTADSILVYKEILKNVALEFGLQVTFMPKPFNGINGSGMHLHISLSNLKGDNLFWDSKEGSISRTAEHFIAGILDHAKALSAFVAPTVNSYKRLVPGYEAPVYICWGYRNRSALIRVPASKNNGCRIEFRAPDPTCNPYLAFTAVLAAGMDGIERNLDLGDPTDWNAYMTPDQFETLPHNLMEAIDEAKNDYVLMKFIGEEIFNAYLDELQKEWDEFSRAITNWELKRYLLRV